MGRPDGVARGSAVDHSGWNWFAAVGSMQILMVILIGVLLFFPVTHFFKRRDLLWMLIPVCILHIVYFVYIGLIGNKGKYMWKGRMVR